MPAFIRSLDLTRSHTRITPTEVVEVPEGVGWQNKVPDREGAEIDAHPCEVGEAGGCNDDEDTREAEDEGQEDERNGGRGSMGCEGYEGFGDC